MDRIIRCSTSVFRGWQKLKGDQHNQIQAVIKQNGSPEDAAAELPSPVSKEPCTNELIWIETGTQRSRDLFCKWLLLSMGERAAQSCLFPCLSASADSFYDTFHTTADMMYFCQMMAVLEVVNPLLGLVKTGFFPSMIQVRLVLDLCSCRVVQIQPKGTESTVY